MSKRKGILRKRYISIGDKVAATSLNSALIMLIVTFVVVAMILSFIVFRVGMSTVSNLAFSFATQLDGDEFESAVSKAKGSNPASVLSDPYIAEKRELFKETMLRYENVKAAFFVVFDKDSGTYTYVFEVEPGGIEEQPGLVESMYEIFDEKSLSQIGTGPVEPFYHSSGQYGKIITAAHPVTRDGKILGYACVNMSMVQIFKGVRRFLLLSFLLLAVIATINMLMTRQYYQEHLVNPLNKIMNAAKKYIYEDIDDDDLPVEDSGHTAFRDLEIKTGDEIEQLSEAMKRMEADLGRYIRNLTKVTSEKQRLSTELSLANRIQLHMLPSIFPAFPDRPEFDIRASMVPAKEVGGDFYDFFMLDRNHLGIVVADVSGKGIPAAMFMMISRTVIRNISQNMSEVMNMSPGAILHKTNDILCDNNKDQMFVTAWMGILDIPTGKLVYSNAGHVKPLLEHAGKWEYDENQHDFVLAGMEGMEYRDHTYSLKPGDFLFIYTDGIIEASDPDENLVGTDRLLDIVSRAPHDTEAFMTYVKGEIDKFVRGADQFDDMTMLVLEYNGPEKKKK